jgi:hypothetical protein
MIVSFFSERVVQLSALTDTDIVLLREDRKEKKKSDDKNI